MKNHEILTGLIRDSLSNVIDYIDQLAECDSVNDDYDDDATASMLDNIDNNCEDIASNVRKVETAIRDTEYDDTALIASINTVAAEVHGLSEDISSGLYDIDTGHVASSIEDLKDSIEYIFHDVEDFITLTRVDRSTVCKANVKHTTISCVSQLDTNTEIILDNGMTINVSESPDVIFELIRKAKRTDYQRYLETIAENGLTEEEIQCYEAYQHADLICPYMSMEETLSKIDEVKKAKAEGFDFSVEKLLAERDKL